MEGLNRTEIKRKGEREGMQMRRERLGETVGKDGGGGEMGQTDGKLISGLKRNAPAMPYRHKKRREKGEVSEGEVEEERKPTYKENKRVKERGM